MLIKVILVLLIGLLMSTRVHAFDYELLTLGAESKAQGGATVLNSLGAPAAIYNPANLSLVKKLEPYIELSAISLKYTYDHPDFEQAELSLNLPIASYGISGRISNKIKFGAFGLFAPASAQKIEIENIPTRQISEDTTLVNIESNGGDSTSYLLGTGLSYSLNKISLGISTVAMKIHGRTMLRDPESNDLVMDIKHDIEHFFLIGGIRWLATNWLTIGSTYQSSYSPVYSITSSAVADGSETYNGFKGHQIKLAASAQLQNYVASAEVQYREHSKTNGDIFTFTARDAVTDNHDTVSYIMGVKRASNWGTIGYSFGLFPSYVGDGMIASRTESNTEYKGNSFGNLDGVSRQTHAVFSELQSRFGKHSLGISYSTGTREMSEDTRGYGTYNLQSVILSLGSRLTL